MERLPDAYDMARPLEDGSTIGLSPEATALGMERLIKAIRSGEIRVRHAQCSTVAHEHEWTKSVFTLEYLEKRP